MRYSYECKKECAELHRQGKWRNPLEGVSTESFRGKIRKWHRPEDFHGPERLKKKAATGMVSGHKTQAYFKNSCRRVSLKSGRIYRYWGWHASSMDL